MTNEMSEVTSRITSLLIVKAHKTNHCKILTDKNDILSSKIGFNFFNFNLSLFLPDPRVMTVVCCSSRIVSGPGCLEAKMNFRRCCGGDDDGDFRYHCFGHLYPSQLRPSWDYQPIRICVAANGQTLWALTWRYRECFLQHFSDLELFHAFSASASVAVRVLLNF